MSGFDIRVATWRNRFEWRTKWRLSFPQYGATRYFRIGKLGIRLWEVQ